MNYPPERQGLKEESHEEKKEVERNAPEGAKIMVSKKDRDQEMYFNATRNKHLREKGNKENASKIK